MLPILHLINLGSAMMVYDFTVTCNTETQLTPKTLNICLSFAMHDELIIDRHVERKQPIGAKMHSHS